MSWSQFKDEVGAKMKECNWKSSDEFASFFTKKYDEAMKRGKDETTGNPVLKGNTSLMEQLMINLGYVGLAAKAPSFYSQYMSIIGQAVVGYWTGCTLQKINIPAIPAPGTILNLQVTSNEVTDPGKFPSTITPPITDVDDFLNNFIMMAKIHHTTIKGNCYTISQYIPPLPPGPAIINWVGFDLTQGKSTAVVEENEQADATDDTPPTEGKAVLEHEKNNGRVVYNKQEDEIQSVPVGDSFYVAPIPEYPESPVVTTISQQNSETDTATNLTISPSSVGGIPVPKPPTLVGQKNGYLDESLLVPVEKNGSTRYGGYYKLEKTAADAFKKWKAQCIKDGFNFTLTSAYRNFEHQQSLGTRPTVAKAGCSPHGYAVAVDVGELYKMVNGSGSPSINSAAKANSKLYHYLAKTGPQFGWYNPLRLADGRGVDECWHWEYWGFYTK